MAGDMVITTIATQDSTAATKKVWALRANMPGPSRFRALYEKGRVHHLGMFASLEDELCNWVPGEGLPSPNRLDALVWSLTELLLQGEAPLPRVDMRRALEGLHTPRRGHMPGAATRPRFGRRIFADEYEDL